MRVVVVQHGRIRDAHVRALRDDYVARFARFGSLTVVEREPKGEAPLWPASCRWRVLLDERGRTLTSQEFSVQLAKWAMHHGEIAFVVGEAYGHHPATRASADYLLALGPLTLPHQLAHLVLVEQIYRAATIEAGLPYHHGT